MPTTVTKSIKATGGDYTDPTSFEAGEQGDLVTADEIRVGELYGETYDDNITIDGSTTDATRYMKISVAAGNRHNGTAGGGGAVINPTGSGHVFTVNDDHFHAEWLRITDWVGSSSEAFRVNNTGFILEKCIIHDSAVASQDGVYVGADSITLNIYNCIFYDIRRAAVSNQGNNSSVVLNIFNSLARGCMDDSDGSTFGQFSSRAGTINVRNCGAFDPVNGSKSDFGKHADASWGSSSNNISSDTSATGGSSLLSKAASDNFVDLTGGSEDYHLKTGADMIAVGVNLSGTFTDDIDGDTRSAWDMGPDEFSAGGGGGLSIPIAAYHYNHHLGSMAN